MENAVIQDPRRSMRASASCHVEVVTPAGRFAAVTEDVGAQGCRLLSTRCLPVGERIQLTLTHVGLGRRLAVPGRIVWVAQAGPRCRAGVFFDPSAHGNALRWFSDLLRFLGLADSPRRPQRLPLSTVLYLGPPPLFAAHTTPADLAFLSRIGAGITVGELLGDDPAQRATRERMLWSLLTQRHVTTLREEAVPLEVWRVFLTVARGPVPAPAARAPIRPATAAGFALPMLQPDGWAQR